MKDNKNSILQEALTDYNAIVDASTIIAKRKLAEEFPDKFNKLLKEELNKKAKEPYKKIGDAEEESEESDITNTNEPDMKNPVKETVKVVDTVGKGKPFDKTAKKVDEDVKVTNTIGKTDPYKEKAKVTIDEEREKDFVADVEAKTPNMGKGKKNDTAFTENPKLPANTIKETFNMRGLDTGSVGDAIDGADGNDNFISLSEIEAEIAQMDSLDNDLETAPEGEDVQSTGGEESGTVSELISMRDKLTDMINAMGGEESTEEMPFDDTASGEEGSEEFQTENELQFDEQPPRNTPSMGGNMPPRNMPNMGMNEMDEPIITDDDINAILGGSQEPAVDEAHGVSYSAGTITPGKLGDNYGSHGRFRNSGVNESKKMKSLIEENKKLTKKLNETKTYKTSVTTLVESYKTALEKYRNQLKEMAVFNTNLAHVNNLLVNESLALTQDEKIKIINEFKKVGSIVESQEKYKNLLTEMKASKSTLTESVENRLNNSIQPSSKQKLDETIVEKTAYKNNEHFTRMKKIIDYVDSRGKK